MKILLPTNWRGFQTSSSVELIHITSRALIGVVRSHPLIINDEKEFTGYILVNIETVPH